MGTNNFVESGRGGKREILVKYFTRHFSSVQCRLNTTKIAGLTFAFLKAEWRDGVLHIVKSPASDERLREVSGNDCHEVRNVSVQHVIDLTNQLLLQIGKLQEICLGEFLLQISDFRHVRAGHHVLLLDFLEKDGQIFDQFFLFPSFSEHLRHVLPQIGNDIGVDLCHPCTLDEVVQFPHGGVPGKVLQVIKQALQLLLKEPPVEVMFELLVPERSNEYFGTFWDVDHFRYRPHQGSVDLRYKYRYTKHYRRMETYSHQFLMVNLVRFVQDNSHFVLIALGEIQI